MIFTSFDFLIFFPLVVGLFYVLPNRFRWALLLFSSYYFYMAWNSAYAVLMFFETFNVYLAALLIDSKLSYLYKKIIVGISISINLFLLFLFKYYNFFQEQILALDLGFKINELDLLLPLGISFYTFHTISYIVDVYRKEIKTERHFGILLLYIAYFPLLVAGPIARAAHLIPQLNKLCSDKAIDKVNFDYEKVVAGLRLMILGFFKKIVLADNLALLVHPVFSSPSEYSATSAFIATLAFSFQIFFDFSAYTDIARGASRVLGIELTRNFIRPYFATSIPEFWRRWHISLSTWFRDYLYIPLGGKRVARWHWFLNLWIVFILCGLWHGANYTFLIWGVLHGFYFLLTYVFNFPINWLISRSYISRDSYIYRSISILVTFILVSWAWVVFRADSIENALNIWHSLLWFPSEISSYISSVINKELAFHPISALGIEWLIKPNGKLSLMPLYLILTIAAYFFIVFVMRKDDDGGGFAKWTTSVRWFSYFFALTILIILGRFGGQQFIYFQF